MIVLGVPTYRRYDLLKLMLQSVDAGTVVPSHCIVVDNGDRLITEELPRTKMEVHVSRPGTNLGVAGGWNRVMRVCDDLWAGSEVVHALITNDDIVFGAKTIENMTTLMQRQEQMVVAADGGEAFSCFLMDRRLFHKVGSFDEQFHPAYFEDNDYVRRMQLLGETFVVAERADGYSHTRSATLSTYTQSEMQAHHGSFEANRNRYILKWGGLPGHEMFQTPGGPR